MNMGDALTRIRKLPYLTLPGTATMEEAVCRLSENQHLRGIYVVDEDGRLTGNLTLGVLVKNLISTSDVVRHSIRSHNGRAHHDQLSEIVSKYVIYAKAEDDSAKILQRMVDYGLKEIPVLDDTGKILANVGILDLWQLVSH